MSKVIQIRGVPDEVHEKLVSAAEAQGKSLTAFLADELELVARRADIAFHNRQIIQGLRDRIAVRPDDGGKAALRALHEGRAEREERQLGLHSRRRP